MTIPNSDLFFVKSVIAKWGFQTFMKFAKLEHCVFVEMTRKEVYMDYRHRNYYLVNLDFFCQNMRIEFFKWAAPSLKIHPPFHHIKTNTNHCSDHLFNPGGQDRLNGRYWRMMLSCRKGESEALEYELNKAVRRDGCGTDFIKLNQEICGQ
jgi:hypothetical protein